MSSADGQENMQGSGSREDERILVSVRVRPLTEKEILRNEVVDWECVNDTSIAYKNHLSPERSMYPTSYTFDRVFRCDCSTRQVYEEGAKAVVLSAVGGINSSVFAYGQTCSGKTYTMSGITEYTMEDIFDYMRKHTEREFQLKFSALEIYNESVRDLLTADNTPLRLLDDPERGTVVEKLTEETLHDWNHFKELLAVCKAQRQIGETFLNETSSRSHQILRLTIESSPREFLGKNSSGSLAATLNFVDLAGSERASQAFSAGSRLKEGSHINRSLLTLGTVIRKLSKGRMGHVPFRDSKLTRILQSSLGGNARTAIICTMSPARSYVEQSRNTLLFASCAKEITTNAQVNVVMSDKALVKHLQRELARLQSQLTGSSPSQKDDASDVLREKDSKIEELERHVRRLTLQLNLALSQIQDLQQGVGDRTPTAREAEDYSYSRSYIQEDSEHSPSDATSVTYHQPFTRGSLPFQTPYSPDRHSRVSYDENYSISDTEENNMPSSPSEQMFTETPGDASPPMCAQTSTLTAESCYQVFEGHAEKTRVSEIDSCTVSKEIDEQGPNSYSAVPFQLSEKMVVPTPSTSEVHLQQVSDGRGPYSSCVVEFDPYHALDETREQTPSSGKLDRHEVSPEIAEEAHDDYHTDKQHSSEEIGAQLEDYSEKVCTDSKRADDAFTNSVPLIEEESLSMDHANIHHQDVESTLETTPRNMNVSSLQDAEQPAGKQQATDMSECRNLSRSCQTDDASCRSLASLEKLMYDIKSENGDGRDEDFIVAPESQMISALGSDEDTEVPQKSTGDIQPDQVSVTDSKASNHMDNAENFSFDIGRKVIAEKPEFRKQLADYQLEDRMHEEYNKSTTNKKDVGLNPQYDLDNSLPWLLDSNKLQKEILDLWHTCNVSLVHRTHFFLLFINGRPADTIYMEVERRRLSFIKDAFSWGNSVALDGRKLTPGSSKKSLNHERGKLGNLMKRRLSSQERTDLYIRWGIDLDTKRRSSKLAHLLWTDTEDTDHIMNSANIVARLVRFSEPQLPKDVVGLNLMAKAARRKSFKW